MNKAMIVGNPAEICSQRLVKGQQTYVEGRLPTRGWEVDNRQRHFRTEVVANEMIILGSHESHDSHPDRSGDGDRCAAADEGACQALLPFS